MIEIKSCIFYDYLISNGFYTIEGGEPCSHKGCLSHLSHPCERCGRIGGRGKIWTNGKFFLKDPVEYEKEINRIENE